MRMIKDCRAGKIDRIYVKSVSRFARNSLECIDYIRELKSCGVSVFFENDGIDSKTMNHELILYRGKSEWQPKLIIKKLANDVCYFYVIYFNITPYFFSTLCCNNNNICFVVCSILNNYCFVLFNGFHLSWIL